MHDMDVISDTAQNMLDTCLCHRTRMAARAVTRAYDEALRPTGLRATQAAVLAGVGARGAQSIKALADLLAMDRSTLTRNLRPLDEQGLVALGPEQRHRRRTLHLTARGEAALRETLPLWEAAQADAKRELGTRWGGVHQAIGALSERIHAKAE
jgi:DNA-binding MarR family transcriptional regulator